MSDPRRSLTRRGMLGGALSVIALPALANAPERSLRPPPRPELRPAPRAAGAAATARPVQGLDALLARANLRGVTGLIAIDAETGAVIEALNPDTPLPPASTAKAPTALYALHALGMEHRFITRVLNRGGAISGGVLRGDLVLEGGGDPTLQTEQLARIADALVATGLRRVEGRFLVDERALPALRQIADNQPAQAGYNPAISGMNLNYNRVHFGWSASGGQVQLTMDARSNRETPRVAVIGVEARAGQAPVFVHSETGAREHWSVAREALGNSGSRWLPVRRPGIYAADVLRVLLASRGCTLPAPQVATSGSGGTVLAEHRSAQMTEMMREMLRFSTNLTAECTGLAASRRSRGQTATLEQSGRQMGEWLAARYGAPGMQFVDHSGLGDRSRVTARAMAAFLAGARREGILPGLLRNHPMRDAQGREARNHPIAVSAKTGTLNFVSTLAGYARPQGGREIVFAIFSADLARRDAIAVAQRERPPGAPDWARRARTLQQALIERWAALRA